MGCIGTRNEEDELRVSTVNFAGILLGPFEYYSS
jgi:hypothetical protein